MATVFCIDKLAAASWSLLPRADSLNVYANQLPGFQQAAWLR